jgi:aspartate racemase
MAFYYVEELLKFHPEGPFYLGGFSFGGFVAFEMARLLTSMGEQVALLALLDTRAGKAPRFTFSLSTAQKLHYRYKSIYEKTTYHSNNLRSLPVGELPGYFTRRNINPVHQDDFVDETVNDQSLPIYFRDVMMANNKSLNNYIPGMYQGKVTIFKSIDHGSGIYYGWEELARGGVSIHYVPGNHTGIIKEPNVQVLAELLKTSINLAGKMQ